MKDYMEERYDTVPEAIRNSFNRRDFVKLSGGAAIAMAVPTAGMSRSTADMPMRTLG
ncbi:MAG: twin-arginine translocation signal domain-containing protein, partial [Eudoraea sp.]|nr:twin-arginine translocation signal domain-containing protein [Eudoraea sp.]